MRPEKMWSEPIRDVLDSHIHTFSVARVVNCTYVDVVVPKPSVVLGRASNRDSGGP